MKLKRKHIEIAKTIAWCVDRSDSADGFPDFKEPTRRQIEIFTQIESKGGKGLTDDDILLVSPLRNGKANYDLQILMVHEEVAEWAMNGWGWGPPLFHTFQMAWPERKNCRVYLRMLVKLIRNMKKDSLGTLLAFTGFDQKKKQQIRNQWARNQNTI